MAWRCKTGGMARAATGRARREAAKQSTAASAGGVDPSARPLLRVLERADALGPRRPISAGPPDWRHLHERSPRRVVAASGQVWLTAHTSGSSSRVAASDERAYRWSPSRTGACLALIYAHPAAASPGLPTRPRTRRDRTAPSLVTLRSHPWVTGVGSIRPLHRTCRFEAVDVTATESPRLRTPWACPPGGAGLMNGWRGSTIRPERV